MKGLFFGIGSAIALATLHPVHADQALADEAKGIIKQFGGQLKGELQAAIKAGGPVEAIEVCNKKAPAIAHDLSEQTGWEVARTSLKLRNPGNAPDAWERQVLERFEADKAAGKDVQKLSYAETVEEPAGKTFRVMKAIPTGKVCLNCHGADTVKPEVEARLADLYPSDQARGFKVGDIRGAFTLSKKLD
jgi:hypothetical protein